MPAFRAKYAFPVSRSHGSVIHDGLIETSDGLITHVGAYDGRKVDFDLGVNQAIIPGLVNAHTHLEFSGLDNPFADESFAGWIRQVIEYRSNDETAVEDHLRAGIAESRRHGVVCVGEIDTLPVGRVPSVVSSDVRVFRFAEVLGRSKARIAEQCERLRTTAADGFSPHAPYSTAASLVQSAVEIAQQRGGCPIAMHLAETREELELLRLQTGPLREMLETRGFWSDELEPLLPSPGDYLKLLASAPRSLVIHGNYFTDEEWSDIANHQDRMTVVYCPRTHAHFGHDDYPLAAAVAKGVPFAIGTDSRASNPDLNLWEDAKFAAGQHPDVAPENILQMVTSHAAAALGLEQELGSIEVGHPARMAVVQIADRQVKDSHELLWEPESRARPLADVL